MSSREVRTHVYQPDWSMPPPRRDAPRLCVCGLPRNNQHHNLPTTSDDASQVEARRLGEH